MCSLKSEKRYCRVASGAQAQAQACRVQAEGRGHRRSFTKVKGNTMSTNKRGSQCEPAGDAGVEGRGGGGMGHTASSTAR